MGVGGYSYNDYEGNDEPAESRSSSFPTSPRWRERESCTQRALSFIRDKDQCCVCVYTLLMMPKIRSFISISVGIRELKRHKAMFVCLCLATNA